ncbi:MAG: hypothetical protein U9N87_06155, partial [Planctomycetota bacterium]|nr:hypothetical protein [Planctomycetota bacterium]
MEDKDRSPKKSNSGNNEKNDKKSPVNNTSLIWYVLGATIIALLLIGLYRPDRKADIPYGDLVRLVDQGAPAKNPDAAIEITVNPDRDEEKEPEEKVRFSKLSDITVGPYEITGKVTAQIIAPEDEKGDPKEDVSFKTARLGLEQDGNALFDRLEKHGFTGVRGQEPPSGWQSHISMLVLVVLMIVFFVFMMRRLGGAGGAMAFGRSRGKLFAQEGIEITF